MYSGLSLALIPLSRGGGGVDLPLPTEEDRPEGLAQFPGAVRQAEFEGPELAPGSAGCMGFRGPGVTPEPALQPVCPVSGVSRVQ